LVRWDEVQAGAITHAIRFTAQQTDQSFLWPARHQAGAAANPSLPPMGARFRLSSTYDISHFSVQAQVILLAMQHYGLILADNGSNWYFGGASQDGWDNGVLDQLKSIPASAFDAVDESSLMIDPNSGQARSQSVPTIPVAPGGGYRMVASDGGIFSFGSARFFGSTGAMRLNQPVVGMAATSDGLGYWLVAADGGIFNFGDARFVGSTGALRLNRPIVGMAATPTGKGYWLVAADGGIFRFGDAGFYGSGGSASLAAPVVGLSATPSGRGYRLAASDGQVLAFGDAAYAGGATALNHPVVGIETTPSGKGYRLVASDGGVFVFGDAAFLGSAGALPLARPVVGAA
jgi:ribosomal protein L24E